MEIYSSIHITLILVFWKKHILWQNCTWKGCEANYVEKMFDRLIDNVTVLIT